MPHYFPGKKVFGVAAIAVLLLVVVQHESIYSKNENVQKRTLVSAVTDAGQTFSDADHDGLLDWEEVLHGTDKNNPDSDGNGVLDGEQHESSQNSIGYNVSDSIFEAINRFSEEDLPIDQTEALTTEPNVYKSPYTLEDLHIVSNTKDNVEGYAYSSMALFRHHEDHVSNKPIELIEEYLASNDQNILEQIRDLSYEEAVLARELLDMNVPEALAETHLDVLNNLTLSSTSLLDFDEADTDPMAGFFSTANYVNYASRYINAVLRLNSTGIEIEPTTI